MATMWSPNSGKERANPVIIVYGQSNSGKTTLAATCANLGNTLFIAYQSQEQVVEQHEYKYALKVYSCETIRDLNSIALWLHNGKKTTTSKTIDEWVGDIKFDYVVLDGFSTVQMDYELAIQTANPSSTKLDVTVDGNIDSGIEPISMDGFKSLKAYTTRLVNAFAKLRGKYTIVITMYEKSPSMNLSRGEDTRAEHKRQYHPLVTGGAYEHVIGTGNILCRMEDRTWREKTSSGAVVVNGKTAYLEGANEFPAWNRWTGTTESSKINNPTMGILLGIEEKEIQNV